ALNGSIAATVVQKLSNGNLVIKGENQLELTEGTETIRVSGVIRSEDVSPNNTVLSKRIANSKITYVGTGDLANASKPGWGTRLFHKYWPF
ncbi:MAG: flagellar basal body L-ring protein FlgH, partial [Hyphomicrobiales bacterium]